MGIFIYLNVVLVAWVLIGYDPVTTSIAIPVQRNYQDPYNEEDALKHFKFNRKTAKTWKKQAMRVSDKTGLCMYKSIFKPGNARLQYASNYALLQVAGSPLTGMEVQPLVEAAINTGIGVATSFLSGAAGPLVAGVVAPLVGMLSGAIMDAAGIEDQMTQLQNAIEKAIADIYNEMNRQADFMQNYVEDAVRKSESNRRLSDYQTAFRYFANCRNEANQREIFNCIKESRRMLNSKQHVFLLSTSVSSRKELKDLEASAVEARSYTVLRVTVLKTLIDYYKTYDPTSSFLRTLKGEIKSVISGYKQWAQMAFIKTMTMHLPDQNANSVTGYCTTTYKCEKYGHREKGGSWFHLATLHKLGYKCSCVMDGAYLATSSSKRCQITVWDVSDYWDTDKRTSYPLQKVPKALYDLKYDYEGKRIKWLGRVKLTMFGAWQYQRDYYHDAFNYWSFNVFMIMNGLDKINQDVDKPHAPATFLRYQSGDDISVENKAHEIMNNDAEEEEEDPSDLTEAQKRRLRLAESQTEEFMKKMRNNDETPVREHQTFQHDEIQSDENNLKVEAERAARKALMEYIHKMKKN